MSRCLVTGGAGFIGGHIVRALLAAGRTVRVVDDLSTGHRANLADLSDQIEFIEGDIRDAATAMRAVADCAFVFHLAARASVPRSVAKPRDAHEVNATGTFNLLVAARDAEVTRFVYSSTSSAYGDTPTLPKVETMPPSPLSPYAASKLAGEQYCKVFAEVYGLATVSLRYFNVFGPRQDPNSDYAAAIPAFATRMLRGERPTVYGDGEQSRDFCYIDNVVAANLLAAESAGVRGQTLNIACGERISLNAIIDMINQALGTQIEPKYQAARVGDVRHSLADINAAAEVIGYRPQVMFAEGLPQALEYYRSLV